MKACELVEQGCARVHIYKHADQFTAGIPDRSFTWRGRTSWVEFKFLDMNHPLHEQKGHNKGLSKVQLMELLALERNSHRAWVLVYRKPLRGGSPITQIYRPSALLRQPGPQFVVPVAEKVSTFDTICIDLQRTGVAQFAGHDHRALVALLHLTHDET